MTPQLSTSTLSYPNYCKTVTADLCRSPCVLSSPFCLLLKSIGCFTPPFGKPPLLLPCHSEPEWNSAWPQVTCFLSDLFNLSGLTVCLCPSLACSHRIVIFAESQEWKLGEHVPVAAVLALPAALLLSSSDVCLTSSSSSNHCSPTLSQGACLTVLLTMTTSDLTLWTAFAYSLFSPTVFLLVLLSVFL